MAAAINKKLSVKQILQIHGWLEENKESLTANKPTIADTAAVVSAKFGYPVSPAQLTGVMNGADIHWCPRRAKGYKGYDGRMVQKRLLEGVVGLYESLREKVPQCLIEAEQMLGLARYTEGSKAKPPTAPAAAAAAAAA